MEIKDLIIGNKYCLISIPNNETIEITYLGNNIFEDNDKHTNFLRSSHLIFNTLMEALEYKLNIFDTSMKELNCSFVDAQNKFQSTKEQFEYLTTEVRKRLYNFHEENERLKKCQKQFK